MRNKCCWRLPLRASEHANADSPIPTDEQCRRSFACGPALGESEKVDETKKKKVQMLRVPRCLNEGGTLFICAVIF